MGSSRSDMRRGPKASSHAPLQGNEDPVGNDRDRGEPTRARRVLQPGSERKTGETQDGPGRMQASGGGDRGPERTEGERVAEAAADGELKGAGAAAARTGQTGGGAKWTYEQSQRRGVEWQR